MNDGKILQRNQDYAPSVPANYPGAAPVNNGAALDEVAALANYANAEQIYVDATSGSDVTGTGSQLRPFQSIPAALLAVVPATPTVITLAVGQYNGADIAWPAGVSIRGADSNTTRISHNISYTAPVGENNFIFQQVSFDNPVIVDLTAATVALCIFYNCSVAITRLAGGAPSANVQLYDCLIRGMEISSTVLMNACLFTNGGGTNNVRAGGQLFLNACIVGTDLDAYGACGIGIIACVLVGPGITGHTIGPDTPAVQSDASSRSFGAPIVGCTVSDLDTAPFLGFAPTTPGNWPVVPANVQDALDTLAADAAPTANPKNNIAFKPGGVTSGNTFDTWAGVIGALSANAGPKTIFIDDSIVTPAVIPAGAYDLSEVTIDNAHNGSGSGALQVNDGVSWVGLVGVKALNSMTFLNTALVESLAQRAMFFEGVNIVANGTSPIWEVPASAQIQLSKGAALTGSGTAACVNIPTGQSLQLVLGQVSTINNLAISSPAADPTAVLAVLRPDETGGFTPQGAQFGGTVSDIPLQNASNLFFAPAIPGNWSVPPTQVAQALDELAASAAAAAGNATNYFVVASNGNDANVGSWSKPFLTIQAAITAAVTAGAGFANQWEILVLPAAAPYAGFTTANGVNVKGLYGDNLGVQVGEIVVSHDASGFATNSVEISDLTVLCNVAVGIADADVNQGSLYLRNLNVIQNSPNEALFLDRPGSFQEVDNCRITNNTAQPAISNAGGTTKIINGTVATSVGLAFISGAAGLMTAQDSTFVSTGGGSQSVYVLGGGTIERCNINNTSAAAASPALQIDNGGQLKAIDCVTRVQGANFNFEVLAGGSLDQANTTFVGGSVAFSNAGALANIPVYNEMLADGSVALTGDLDLGTHLIHNVVDPVAAQDAATKNYVDTLPPPAAPNLGAVLTAGNDAGAKKIVNLLDPTLPQDASTKAYTDTQAGAAQAGAEAYSDSKEVLNVRLDGSRPMTGALDMNTHLIHNVVDPAAAQDAATKNYVDTGDAAVAATAAAAEVLDVRLDGSRPMTGALDMNTQLIHNVVDPVVAQDAATKNYVDVAAVHPNKETILIDATVILNQFVDLAHLIKANSLTLLWSAAQPPFEGDDYTLSTVAGVTRISFVAGGALNTFAVAGQKLQPGYLF